MGEKKRVSDNYKLNKGHYTIDTEERLKLFREKLGRGWEKEYEDYRHLWDELPKRFAVRDYPLLVDLELSSMCNLRCPMCYTNTDEFKKTISRRFMEQELIKKVIDEVSGRVYALRLSLRGESTLSPVLVWAIRYAKSCGIKEVSMLTHGQKLTGAYLNDIIAAGIDWITISIDGLGDEYESIRKPLTWDGTFERVKEIAAYKSNHGLEKPVIKAQGVWPAIKKDPSKYYNTLSPFVDLVAFNPLIDYLHNDELIKYESDFHCGQLYQRLVINSDGRYMMCCNDSNTLYGLGSAYDVSVFDAWHSDVLTLVRENHKTVDGFMCYGVCRNCYYPRKTQVNESAEVNGRVILIENYVGRAQKVGA